MCTPHESIRQCFGTFITNTISISLPRFEFDTPDIWKVTFYISRYISQTIKYNYIKVRIMQFLMRQLMHLLMSLS